MSAYLPCLFVARRLLRRVLIMRLYLPRLFVARRLLRRVLIIPAYLRRLFVKRRLVRRLLIMQFLRGRSITSSGAVRPWAYAFVWACVRDFKIELSCITDPIRGGAAGVWKQ